MTQGHNIVVDRWAGAPNPQPHSNHSPKPSSTHSHTNYTNCSIRSTHFSRFQLERDNSNLTNRPTDGHTDNPSYRVACPQLKKKESKIGGREKEEKRGKDDGRKKERKKDGRKKEKEGKRGKENYRKKKSKIEKKQGRMHGSISRRWVGTIRKPKKVTLLLTNGPTDQKVAYRFACPPLK